MLLGLLPGLRQLRAPFISGAFYLLVAWVALGGRERLPQTNDPGAVGRIADLAQLVGPGVTLATVGLCAYMLGTFVVINDWPQFLTLGHWRSLPYALSQEDFKSVRFGSLVRALVVEPLQRLAFWRRWRSKTYLFWELTNWRRREYPYDQDPSDPVYLYDRADGLGTEMVVRRTHAWAGNLDYWVWRHMDNLHRTFSYEDLKSLDPSDDFLGAVHTAWDDFREFLWRRANNEFNYRGGDWDRGLDPATLPDDVSMPPKSFNLRDDQTPPWEASVSGWVKNEDHEWWRFEQNLTEEVHHVVLSEAFLAVLPDERKRLIARLKAQGEIHFNDYDRAKAEAELRYSVAVPLVLLIAVLAISWSLIAILAAFVPVVMVKQGLNIERAGFADLYLALQHAAIQSPTMTLLYEARERARGAKNESEAPLDRSNSEG